MLKINCSIEIGHEKVVELLINNGANVNVVACDGDSALNSACVPGTRHNSLMTYSKCSHSNAKTMF